METKNLGGQCQASPGPITGVTENAPWKGTIYTHIYI